MTGRDCDLEIVHGALRNFVRDMGGDPTVPPEYAETAERLAVGIERGTVDVVTDLPVPGRSRGRRRRSPLGLVGPQREPAVGAVSGPRTVAGMYGTGIPTEDAPTVTRTILDGGEDYAVDVDLTPAAAVMLEALATAILNDDGRTQEFLIVARNRSFGPERRALAVRELLTSEPVRRALTLRLTPETAVKLAYDFDNESLEPERCEATIYAATRTDPAEGCPRYIEDGETTCPQHAEPDDTTDRYGL
jgi:hypothetical protein